MLAPPMVPIAHSRSDAFDAMVLHAIDHLQPRLGDQLAEVEFAVEDVPEVGPVGLPELGDDVLDDNAVLRSAFATLTPGRRKSYIFHVSSAKQAKTRAARAEKCVPMILSGRGFNELPN